MEYVYAALVLHETDKEVSEGNLRKVIEAAGVEVDDAKLKSLVVALDGVNIEEAMAMSVMMPQATQTAAPEQESVQEEAAAEEEEEEEESFGLGGLFG